MQIATAHLHETINMSSLLSRPSREALHWQNTLVLSLAAFGKCPKRTLCQTIRLFKRYLDQKVEHLFSGLSVASHSQSLKLERQAEGIQKSQLSRQPRSIFVQQRSSRSPI